MGCHLSWAFQTDSLVLISLKENRKTKKINRGTFPFLPSGPLCGFTGSFFSVTLVDFGVLKHRISVFLYSSSVVFSREKEFEFLNTEGWGQSVCLSASLIGDGR